MLEKLLEGSALPNLHPAIVHFPIALVVVALATDIAALALASRRWLAHMGLALWIMAALAGWAAVETGDDADHSVEVGTAAAKSALHEHEEWGERTGWLIAGAAALRLVAAIVSARRVERFRPAVAVALVAGLGAGYSLFETAEHGGQLVYGHGLGVSGEVTGGPARPRPPGSSASPSSAVPVSGEEPPAPESAPEPAPPPPESAPPPEPAADATPTDG